jgi:predicted O-linked N-acetylglucosamine transferase (SPINDLY family)
MDYCVVDPVIAPKHLRHAFTEKLMILPTTYQANSYRELHARAAEAMSDYGGTADVAVRPFIFVNFNRLEKLEPHVLAAWTRVLIRVPSAQLHLLASPLEGCVAVTTALRVAGIAEVGTRTCVIYTLLRPFYPPSTCKILICTHTRLRIA